MDQLVYTQYEQLPLSLCASDIAAVLSISRANAYNLLRREDFPTLHIGKRMVVPKDRFFLTVESSGSPPCLLPNLYANLCAILYANYYDIIYDIIYDIFISIMIGIISIISAADICLS